MRSPLLGAFLAVVLVAPASASFKCKTWQKLEPEQQREALLERIEQAVTSNDAKKYGSINKVQVRRCMERRIPELRDQFDGICMDAKSASLQALEREFERHIWTCVGRRS